MARRKRRRSSRTLRSRARRFRTAFSSGAGKRILAGTIVSGYGSHHMIKGALDLVDASNVRGRPYKLAGLAARGVARIGAGRYIHKVGSGLIDSGFEKRPVRTKGARRGRGRGGSQKGHEFYGNQYVKKGGYSRRSARKRSSRRRRA